MPPNDNQTHLPDFDKLISMESFDPQEDQLTMPEPGESVKLDSGEKESQPHLVSIPSTMKEVMGKNPKSEKVEMTLSLVHGDVLLLEGDDFERNQYPIVWLVSIKHDITGVSAGACQQERVTSEEGALEEPEG
ncbi:hypothetical protein AGABI2DRAFT_118536 [Agaricus bisporus var. bisporus H97]|uniref:hypothetical protein n=1 Tax=Agaricus bisporus var. bisporus (strain H97 / ATCC MYA-4626 / FGSC 10389) TaxID=936046 RepID=UPI00029F5D72|nr:hypothetical protein AGABI2DRAFT_118536 [Agaricus bisporus var. bisporus H97]EKV46347.1 hypothetical protein AGABI2DRAFT_118536 [Agaricus bisporus var. bisporus H97]